MLSTLIGSLAAFCTTVSYLPQVIKVWKTQSTEDLSLKMLLVLASGVSLWVVYGVMKKDFVIIAANASCLILLSIMLYFKITKG